MITIEHEFEYNKEQKKTEETMYKSKREQANETKRNDDITMKHLSQYSV